MSALSTLHPPVTVYHMVGDDFDEYTYTLPPEDAIRACYCLVQLRDANTWAYRTRTDLPEVERVKTVMGTWLRLGSFGCRVHHPRGEQHEQQNTH